jgi:chromosome segregation ATPase
VGKLDRARNRLTETERARDEDAAALGRAEEQLTALREVVAERDAAVTAATHRAAVAEEEKRAAATAEYQMIGEVGRLRREMAMAVVTAQAHAVEIALLHERLATAEQQAQQAAEALRSEIAALRDDLVRREHEAQESGAAVQKLQSELAAARDALTHSESTTEELREQLDASRRVGRELIAAFRGDILSVPQPAELPTGWRYLFRRLGWGVFSRQSKAGFAERAARQAQLAE